MKHRIIGDTIQTIAIELAPEESIFGRLGSLLFVKGAVRSDSNPEGPYWATIRETVAPPGTNPIIVYHCESGGGLVGFSTQTPGRIHQLSLDQSQRVVVKRDSILAASEGIMCDRLHLPGEDSGDVPPHLFVTLSGSGHVYLHGPGNHHPHQPLAQRASMAGLKAERGFPLRCPPRNSPDRVALAARSAGSACP
ncbi:MAG: AIM24 family protein, partial [bacterium]|nr:AIM24 family protein [bacterium]